jgi:hypothetical protein
MARYTMSAMETTPERVAMGRIVAGVTMLALPRRMAAAWSGSADERAALLAQAVGGRDVALGLGALIALRRGAPSRGWFEAAALSDGVDAFATLLALRKAPGIWRAMFLVAAIAGLIASQRVAFRTS